MNSRGPSKIVPIKKEFDFISSLFYGYYNARGFHIKQVFFNCVCINEVPLLAKTSLYYVYSNMLEANKIITGNKLWK